MKTEEPKKLGPQEIIALHQVHDAFIHACEDSLVYGIGFVGVTDKGIARLSYEEAKEAVALIEKRKTEAAP